MLTTKQKPHLLLRPYLEFVFEQTSACGRKGGAFVHVADEKGADGEWINTRPLPHVPDCGGRHSRHSAACYHSPDGFNYGYGGSGPMDLAIAICSYLGYPREVAPLIKDKFVARLEGNKSWDIPIEHIKMQVEQWRAQK